MAISCAYRFRPLALFAFNVLSLLLSLGARCAHTYAQDATCSDLTDVNTAPRILRNGVLETIDESSFHQAHYRAGGKQHSVSVASIDGGESVQLRYVRGFLSPDEIERLISICDARSGWTNSPQNLGGDASAVTADRTSNSCPIIWPLLYLPRLDQIKASGRLTGALEDEIFFAWGLIQRIASFLGVDESRVEPLQLIRYNPGEFYRQHHDHGSYYGANTEQRPTTFLIFLSNMPADDGGGHTKFGELDIAVLPRAGDGLIWSNADDEGGVLSDALHEAVPPKSDGNMVKYAMNVWIARDPIMENIKAASYRTA